MDYTPTTEQVRWQFSTDSPSEFMPEQFDRWLAEEIRKAKTEAWYQGATDAVNYALTGDYLPENPYDNEPTP